MKEAKKTLRRIILLIWILAAAVVVVGGIIYAIRPINLLPYMLGIVLGSVVSTLLMIHRFNTLDIELDMDKKKAKNHLKAMATLRSIIALAALFAGFYWPRWFHPATVFIGLFATKVAALLYPVFFREVTPPEAMNPVELQEDEDDLSENNDERKEI